MFMYVNLKYSGTVRWMVWYLVRSLRGAKTEQKVIIIQYWKIKLNFFEI